MWIELFWSVGRSVGRFSKVKHCICTWPTSHHQLPTSHHQLPTVVFCCHQQNSVGYAKNVALALALLCFGFGFGRSVLCVLDDCACWMIGWQRWKLCTIFGYVQSDAKKDHSSTTYLPTCPPFCWDGLIIVIKQQKELSRGKSWSWMRHQSSPTVQHQQTTNKIFAQQHRWDLHKKKL